jgi:hypothetical protein
MSAGVAVIVGVSLAVVLLIAVVVWLLWSSRVGARPFEAPETQYRREMGELHSPRNRKAMRIREAKRRRELWVAGGAAGAAGLGGVYGGGGGGCGGGGCGGSGGCGGGGCGGSGGCGGGGGGGG